MIAWFSCVPLELSPCSLNVLPCMGGEQAKGEEKSTGLLSSYLIVSANGKLLTSGGASVFTPSSLVVGTSSLVLIELNRYTERPTWQDEPRGIRHDGKPKLFNVPHGVMHQSASVMMAY